MKILALHNKYLIPGGEDISHSGEVTMLRDRGHIVDEFVVSNQAIDQIGLIRTSIDTIWSRRSHQAVSERVQAQRYDLAVVHNFFPLLSPSIFFAMQKANVPVVQNLSNYRLICINAHLSRNHSPCELCLGKSIPWPGWIHRCYRDSVLGSTVLTSMLVFHRWIKTWKNQVDCFLAPSHFTRQMFVKAGFPEEKISVKPEFVAKDPGFSAATQDHAIFVGRLSREKGVHLLVSAFEKLPHIPLKLIGEGPLKTEILNRGLPNITLLGSMEHSQVLAEIQKSRLLIQPSTTYETFGRTIIEAYACGAPVIASNLGAMAELVHDGQTGLHFTPGDPSDLAEKVRWAFTHPAELSAMRASARREYETCYTAEQNYARLMSIFSSVISEHSSPIDSSRIPH